MHTQRLTNKQLETRINAFLARKTDQFYIEDPLENIEPETRSLVKEHTVNVHFFSPKQIIA